jgi:hypothetical protein
MPRAALSKSFCLGRIQIQQNVKHAKVLQYDGMTGDLRVWFWPVNRARERVTPADLGDYRKSHKFRAPSCLCASDGIDAVYTESAIFMAVGGEHSGEYLAVCAMGRCGYTIFLDSVFKKPGLHVGEYPERAVGEPVPALVKRLPGLTKAYSVPTSSGASMLSSVLSRFTSLAFQG